jgi:phosphotransferase system  glucose/maltose/N-acetylglucosamine-specific IIC component
VLTTAVALLYLHPMVFELGLTLPMAGRIALAVLLLLPLAFCLGMPFPLGILALSGKPPGAVAWAWALNAVFTVLGGYLSIVISIKLGFRIALWLAIGAYVVAFFSFFALRRTYGMGAPATEGRRDVVRANVAGSRP